MRDREPRRHSSAELNYQKHKEYHRHRARHNLPAAIKHPYESSHVIVRTVAQEARVKVGTASPAVKKLGLQGGLSLTSWGIGAGITGISTGAGLAIGDKFGLMDSLSDPKTEAILIAAFGANYATNIITSWQNSRLLEDKKIGACNNLWQFVPHWLAEKAALNWKRTRFGLTFSIALAASAGQDYFLWWDHLQDFNGGYLAMGVKEGIAAGIGVGWILFNRQMKKRFGSKDETPVGMNPIKFAWQAMKCIGANKAESDTVLAPELSDIQESGPVIESATVREPKIIFDKNARMEKLREF